MGRASGPRSTLAERRRQPVPIRRLLPFLLRKRTQRESGGRACGDDRDDADLETPQRHDRRDANRGRGGVEAAAETLRPEHVRGEEHRQVGDDADDGGGDAGKRRSEAKRAVRRFDERCADQDEQERRQEREEGHERGGEQAAGEKHVGAEHLLAPAADEADEGHHHDQRPGRGFAEREPVDHLRGCQPLVVHDRALEHVRQHRIRTAERQQRRLGEEPAHLRRRAVPALPGDEPAHCREPDRDENDEHA